MSRQIYSKYVVKKLKMYQYWSTNFHLCPTWVSCAYQVNINRLMTWISTNHLVASLFTGLYNTSKHCGYEGRSKFAKRSEWVRNSSRHSTPLLKFYYEVGVFISQKVRTKIICLRFCIFYQQSLMVYQFTVGMFYQ